MLQVLGPCSLHLRLPSFPTAKAPEPDPRVLKKAQSSQPEHAGTSCQGGQV